MKKSFHLGLYEHFDPVRTADSLVHLKQGVTMPNAEASYWKQQDEEAVLQEFDGHYGFLYYIDVRLDRQRHIPVEVDRADMHILYVLQSPGQTRLYDTDVRPVCQLDSQRAVYLYLPPEEYSLCLPRGRTLLFGFYFRAKIFRAGNDTPYGFLELLLQAYRDGSAVPMRSIDFKVGPRTRRQIQSLVENLHPKQLHNEGFILNGLIRLIELSKEKISEEETKVHYELHIARQAERLLHLYIQQHGQYARLAQLEDDLPLGLPAISRMYKRYSGKSLRNLRDDLLAEKAKELLRSGISPTECAYMLQYNSPEAFYHFFKKTSGTTPKQYIQQLNRH